MPAPPQISAAFYAVSVLLLAILALRSLGAFNDWYDGAAPIDDWYDAHDAMNAVMKVADALWLLVCVLALVLAYQLGGEGRRSLVRSRLAIGAIGGIMVGVVVTKLGTLWTNIADELQTDFSETRRGYLVIAGGTALTIAGCALLIALVGRLLHVDAEQPDETIWAPER